MTDEKYMQIALRLAHRGLGIVAPNPSVGCVIVKNDQIVGRGWTAPGGRPHAEPQAIERAGKNCDGATAYVTLEPCCHHGETPPCTGAIINSGIKKVVVACEDPDPRVSGEGIELLKKAGIEVEVGVLEEEAKELNEGFFLKILENRPFITLKLAISKDYKMGRPGHTVQITGLLSLAFAHMLRKKNDAIMVGKHTMDLDKPSLTCRLPGLLDTSPRIVEASRNIDSHLKGLAESGVTRLLIEGGAKVAESYIETGYVDEIILIENLGMELGKDGIPAPQIPIEYKITKEKIFGHDIASFYRKN